MRSSRVLCLLLCSCFICGVLCIPASANDTLTDEYCQCAEEARERFYDEETEKILCLTCGLEIEPETPIFYLPVGYGTTFSSNAFGAHFINVAEGLGTIGYKQIMNFPAVTQLNAVDKDQQIYTQTLATWSGEVPAGTDKFKLAAPNGTSTPSIAFYSNGWSGSDGRFSGTVTAYLGYGPSHSSYTTKIYPTGAHLYFQYEGSSDWSWIGGYTPANGKITISKAVDSPVQKIRINFTFDSNTTYTNNFPSPTVCWGLTYFDTMQWVSSVSDSGDQTVSELRETNGLLTGILSGLNNIFQSITDLPGKIADAIKSLFVPSQDDLTAVKTKYEQLLSERLGFVWQAGDMVNDFFSDFHGALQDSDEYEFVFPGIAFPMNGELIVICEEMTVDLDNDVMVALRTVLGTVVTIISVLGFISVARDMAYALISGKSYYDFLHRKEEDG